MEEALELKYNEAQDLVQHQDDVQGLANESRAMRGDYEQQQACGARDAEAFAYRPDIDGLRAIAVLAVVVFHLDRTLLPGGFTGVDVFFVISGYVVSGSLLKTPSATTGGYFLNFYARRIKRIVPALLLTVLATGWALAILVPPSTPELEGYYKSGMFALLGAANMRYASLVASGSYFDDGSGPGSLQNNPFLHNWSLGVEEQFYTAFPFILFATHGVAVSRTAAHRPPWCKPLVIWMFLVLVSALASWAATALDPLKAFFWLPPRFWELAIGSVLLQLRALCSPQDVFAQRRCELVLLEVSTVTLLACGLLFTSGTSWFPFPGAGVSVAGAALCITVGSCPGSKVASFLRHWLLVYVGKLSYSLYLWHWPLFVMLKWAFGEDALVPAKMKAYAVASAFALAAATYHLVERPSRFWNPGGLRIAAVLLLAGIIVSELFLVGLQGPFAGRFYFDAVPPDVGTYTNFSDVGSTTFASPDVGTYTNFPDVGSTTFASSTWEPKTSRMCECRIQDQTHHTPIGARSGRAAAGLRPCFSGVAGWRGALPKWAKDPCFAGPSTHKNIKDTLPDKSKAIRTCLKPEGARLPGRRVFFVIGDSHAAHLLPVVRLLAGAISAEIRLMGSLCGFAPRSALEAYNKTFKYWAYCKDFIQEERIALLSATRAGDVVFVSLIAAKLRAGAPVADYRAMLVELHAALVERGAALVVAEDSPYLYVKGARCVPTKLNPGAPKKCQQNKTKGKEYIEPAQTMLAGLAQEHPGIVTFDYFDLFCDDNECGALIPGTKTLGIFDNHHLTDYTGPYLFPFLCARLDEYGLLPRARRG